MIKTSFITLFGSLSHICYLSGVYCFLFTDIFDLDLIFIWTYFFIGFQFLDYFVFIRSEKQTNIKLLKGKFYIAIICFLLLFGLFVICLLFLLGLFNSEKVSMLNILIPISLVLLYHKAYAN